MSLVPLRSALLAVAAVAVFSSVLPLASANGPPRSESGVDDVVRNYGLIVLFTMILPAIYFYTRPLHAMSRQEKEGPVVVSFNYLTMIRVGSIFASGSIYGAVFFSMLLHFDAVTATHCNVPNPLPTISAAVGYGLPERWIFRFGIMFMSGGRLLDALVLYHLFRKEIPQTHFYHFLNRVHFWADQCENLCLFGLTYITSTEYYELSATQLAHRSAVQIGWTQPGLHYNNNYHEKSFVFWVFFQWIKIAINMVLFRKSRGPNFSPQDAKVWFYKKLGAFLDVFSFVVCIVTFIAHNMTCYPYLYAIYALFEYVLVFANILFNYTIVLSMPAEATVIVTKTSQLNRL